MYVCVCCDQSLGSIKLLRLRSICLDLLYSDVDPFTVPYTSELSVQGEVILYWHRVSLHKVLSDHASLCRHHAPQAAVFASTPATEFAIALAIAAAAAATVAIAIATTTARGGVVGPSKTSMQ